VSPNITVSPFSFFSDSDYSFSPVKNENKQEENQIQTANSDFLNNNENYLSEKEKSPTLILHPLISPPRQLNSQIIFSKNEKGNDESFNDSDDDNIIEEKKNTNFRLQLLPLPENKKKTIDDNVYGDINMFQENDKKIDESEIISNISSELDNEESLNESDSSKNVNSLDSNENISSNSSSSNSSSLKKSLSAPHLQKLEILGNAEHLENTKRSIGAQTLETDSSVNNSSHKINNSDISQSTQTDGIDYEDDEESIITENDDVCNSHEYSEEQFDIQKKQRCSSLSPVRSFAPSDAITPPSISLISRLPSTPQVISKNSKSHSKPPLSPTSTTVYSKLSVSSQKNQNFASSQKDKVLNNSTSLEVSSKCTETSSSLSSCRSQSPPFLIESSDISSFSQNSSTGNSFSHPRSSSESRSHNISPNFYAEELHSSNCSLVSSSYSNISLTSPLSPDPSTDSYEKLFFFLCFIILIII
jgi:hypothetical protein